MTKRWLIVGCGFTGAVLAERIAAERNERVLIIDRRDHIAGNAHDARDANGVLIHTYGPHIFHTASDRIFRYLSRFTDWIPYEHRVLAQLPEHLIPVPFNFTALRLVFGRTEGDRLIKMLTDEYGIEVKVPILKMRQAKAVELRRLADFIYENVFYHYTKKQWVLEPEELDASVTARVPVHLSEDDRYFQDAHQSMPAAGYTALFRRMLAHPNITIALNTEYRDVVDEAKGARVIYTGPIDAFFGYAEGALPYRSLEFAYETRPVDRVQSVAQVNYPTPHPAFTRITEFKHLTRQDIPCTTLAKEYSRPHRPGENEPFYPIPRPDNAALHRRYRDEADRNAADVVFAGRLADYKYYNMDQAVGRALSIFDALG